MIKAVETWNVATIVDSIVIAGVLTRCALLHSVCDMKATQINVQCSLIWYFMLHGFKLGHNAAETIKNIYCAKGEDLFYCRPRWCKEFCMGYKNVDDQER